MRIVVFEMPTPASRSKRFIGSFLELGHEVIVVRAVKPEGGQGVPSTEPNLSEVTFTQEMINPLNQLVRNFNKDTTRSPVSDLHKEGLRINLERRTTELPPSDNWLDKQIVAKAIRTPIPSVRHGGFANVYTLLPNWLMATEAIVKADPDLIWAVDLDSLPAGVWASQISNKPIVYQADELFQDLDYLIPSQRQEWVEIAESFVPCASAVVTVCESASRILESEFGAKQTSEIFNLAFEAQNTHEPDVRTKCGFSSADFLAVMIGNVVPKRGIESAIQMLLEDTLMNLAIVGNGTPEYIADLIKFANELGVASRVHFVGSYGPEALCNGISTADVNLILLDPNISRNHKHAMPNKLFDGLASGLPCVAIQGTDVGDFLTLNNFGLTYTYGDNSALARAARAAIEHREQVSQAKAKFTWSNNTQKISSILSKLVVPDQDKDETSA